MTILHWSECLSAETPRLHPLIRTGRLGFRARISLAIVYLPPVKQEHRRRSIDPSAIGIHQLERISVEPDAGVLFKLTRQRHFWILRRSLLQERLDPRQAQIQLPVGVALNRGAEANVYGEGRENEREADGT